MTPQDVRQRLIDALEADLVGPFLGDQHPGGGQEVLPLPPSRWYMTGFLAPQFGCTPDAADPDAGELGLGSESQAEDAGVRRPRAGPRYLGPPPRTSPASSTALALLPAPDLILPASSGCSPSDRASVRAPGAGRAPAGRRRATHPATSSRTRRSSPGLSQTDLARSKTVVGRGRGRHPPGASWRDHPHGPLQHQGNQEGAERSLRKTGRVDSGVGYLLTITMCMTVSLVTMRSKCR